MLEVWPQSEFTLVKYFSDLNCVFLLTINIFSARDVEETLRTSMLSNIMRLLDQIHIVSWSVWTTGVCGEFDFFVCLFGGFFAIQTDEDNLFFCFI